MATFKYKAISKDGASVSGIMEGRDEYDAVAKIKESCNIVLKIEPVKQRSSILAREIYLKKIDYKALSMVCSQFAVILTAGLPVAQCVELVAAQTQEKQLKRILEAAAKEVASGVSLADSFETAGKGKIPLTFIETVRSGEQSGTLEKGLERLSFYYESRYKTTQKVGAALTYPVFVIIIAIIVVIVVMVKLIPTITGIFGEFGGELPWITKAMIHTSGFFQKYILLIVFLVGLGIMGFLMYTRSEKGKIGWNRFKLKVPILGRIAMLNASSQFANTMSTLLSAGIPVPQALGVTARTMDNYMLSIETGKMVTGLEEGRHLGICMKESGCYPMTLTDMCVIGEQTGELEETLRTVGRFFDNEAENATQKALAKLEPAVLVFIALLAGFIVFSIYLPMFQIYDMI